MGLIELILSWINSIFKGTTNEKNENGNEEKVDAKEIRQSTEEIRQENASKDDEENEQKRLQVIGGYMITLKEILGSKDLASLPQEHQDNLAILLERINKIRVAWNKSMTVTSGYRSMAEHLEIYRKKGITDQSKIPMRSRHLIGAAIDIYDPNKLLQSWILDNVKLLEEVGLWCEDFSATKNWVHFQIMPPASGKRFFKP